MVRDGLLLAGFVVLLGACFFASVIHSQKPDSRSHIDKSKSIPSPAIHPLALSNLAGASTGKNISALPPVVNPIVLPAPILVPIKLAPVKDVPIEAPKRPSVKGRIVACLEADVKCKVDGLITNVLVDAGDTVKKGQTLLELDSSEQQTALNRAQLVLDSSRTRLVQAREAMQIAETSLGSEKAKLNAELKSARVRAQRTSLKQQRLKDTLGKHFISQELYDEADADALCAGANVESIQADLDDLKSHEMKLDIKRQDVHLAEGQVEMDMISLMTAERRLADTRVVSPIDGIVTQRNVQPGYMVAGTLSGHPSHIITVSNLSKLFALASVPLARMSQVKLDDVVEMTTEAFPDYRFHGRIVSIAPRGGLDQNGHVTFEVKIEIFDERRAILKPEMTVAIAFTDC